LFEYLGDYNVLADQFLSAEGFSMFAFFTKLFQTEDGATAIEYGLIAH
jgi:hypothetical protein